MMKSIWKSTMGGQAFKDTMGAIGAVVLFIILFALIWATAAGFGSPPDVTPEPNPQIESLIQQQKDLDRRMETLEQDMQEMLKQLNRILGAGEFEATAYTHVAVPGIADINGNGDGLTATGIPVREGLCAVDPKVIPLGSKVWVEGFGVLTAADVGGAIKGNRIDIFMDSRKAAFRFGRRPLRVVWYSAEGVA